MNRLPTIAIALGITIGSVAASAQSWHQWAGPNRNFIVESEGLADKWPDDGPRVIWTRPLGTGHSAIAADGGLLFTMYRVGNGRGGGGRAQGPFAAEESVIALDAATGKTVWEHKYPSALADFSFGAGPHSTPLVVSDRVFTLGTNNQLFAFDKRSGKVLWSHDLVKEFNAPPLLIRPVVKVGYGCSLIAYRDTIICSVGGPGQSVMAFRQNDGSVVWKSGDFLNSDAPPVLINFGGRDHVVFLAGGTVVGLDPNNGEILWAHPHDPGNDLNCNTPLWGPDNVLFVSSAYKAGSRAIQLRQEGAAVMPEELWFTNRVRFMFLNPVRIGDYVYGTTGDFGPAFLTALNIKTGQAAWQHRGFGRASILYADGKAIIMDEDGDLALAKLAPEGVSILSEAKIFDTTSWTVPTLIGATLYARDREKIVALDLGKEGQMGRGGSASARTNGQRATADRQIMPSASPRGASPAPPVSPAQFRGTWKLDRARSKVADAAGLAGLIPSGAPDILHITQPANGTLIVESQINEGHARMYKAGGKTSTPAGQGGSITMTSKWDGPALVSEGSRASASGASATVKETFALAPDGTLTISVTAAEGATSHASTLVYAKTTTVGSCETWPTPCKIK